MAGDVNVERGKWPESVVWITRLSGRQNQRPLVEGCRSFKIIMTLSSMYFLVTPVSS